MSHVLLGGVRRSGGCLVWTLMAPFATLSFIGDSHFREADLDTHEWPANHLVRQKRVRIILLARTLLVMLLICLNDSLPVYVSLSHARSASFAQSVALLFMGFHSTPCRCARAGSSCTALPAVPLVGV